MQKPTLTLAAALLLGGATFAYAQRDGGGFEPPSQGPSHSMERGPSDGPGVDGRPMRRSEGPDPAVRDASPAAEPSEAVREDAPAPRDTKATETRPDRAAGDRGGDKGRGKERAAREDKAKPKGDISEPKSTRQETKQDKAGAVEKSAERAKDEARGRDKAAGKAPAEPASKSAERERAPAEAAKNAEAAGDRKPLDEVKKADLSGDRRERVSTVFRDRHDVKRRTDVDINIVIGAQLPSAWDYAPVPVEVVEVVPEYRGYYYTYVDDTYVIADPATYEVVAVLPATGGGATVATAGGGVCSTNLALTDDERDLLLRSIQLTDEVAVSDITVGWAVPRDIELKRFPKPVIERASALQPCRYFIADDQIAIVDPKEEEVVLLVEQQ